MQRPPASSQPHLAPLLLWGLLLFSLLTAALGAGQGFKARFTLSVQDASSTTSSEGLLEYLSPRQIHLEVLKPERQQLHLTPTSFQLFYPQKAALFESKQQEDSANLYFDSLTIAVEGLDARIFQNARLLIRTHTRDQKLRQQWQLPSAGRKAPHRLEVLEGPQGIEQLIHSDDKQRVLQDFRFGSRTLIGGQRIPGTIQATINTPNGTLARLERWTLSDIAPLPPTGQRLIDKPLAIPPGVTPRALD